MPNFTDLFKTAAGWQDPEVRRQYLAQQDLPTSPELSIPVESQVDPTWLGREVESGSPFQALARPQSITTAPRTVGTPTPGVNVRADLLNWPTTQPPRPTPPTPPGPYDPRYSTEGSWNREPTQPGDAERLLDWLNKARNPEPSPTGRLLDMLGRVEATSGEFPNDPRRYERAANVILPQVEQFQVERQAVVEQQKAEAEKQRQGKINEAIFKLVYGKGAQLPGGGMSDENLKTGMTGLRERRASEAGVRAERASQRTAAGAQQITMPSAGEVTAEAQNMMAEAGFSSTKRETDKMVVYVDKAGKELPPQHVANFQRQARAKLINERRAEHQRGMPTESAMSPIEAIIEQARAQNPNDPRVLAFENFIRTMQAGGTTVAPEAAFAANFGR